MPFKSKAQNAWAHTEEGTKALGGPTKVKEWESATDYKHLPARKGYAQGGVVKKVAQDVGDHIPKGEPFEHTRTAGGGGQADKGIGGNNDGHGIYDPMFASGGPVLKDGVDKHYKTPTRSPLGQFLGSKDRFSGGRKPAGFPVEADTEEDWTKPKGVGLTEPDDQGDTKCLKPILPHTKEGHYDYTAANRQEDVPSSPLWRKGRIGDGQKD